MEDEIDKIKKKIKKDFDNFEVDEDSDIPVHEKRAKDKKFRNIE